MAKGIDITGQGINFLVTIEGTDAIKFLKDFEKNFQNVERSVDTVVQQIGSSFDRITNSMEEYIEELNKNPNMVGPGGGTSKQVAGMEKVKKTIQEVGKMLQENIKGATQETSSLNRNVGSLTGSLDRASDEAKELEEALGEAASIGDKLKDVLAFAGVALSIGALVNESVEWNRMLTKSSILMKDAGVSAKDFHQEILNLATATSTSASEIAQMEQQMMQLGITDQATRGIIIEHSAKLAKIFDVDKSAMASFYGELHQKNLVSIKDIQGLSSALVRLQQIGFAEGLPGSMQGDIDAVQRREGQLQKLKEYGESKGMTPDESAEAAQRQMMNVALMERKMKKHGMDTGIIDDMLELPEQFAEKGGQMARGFLSQGGQAFNDLGMGQVNPQEVVDNIIAGRMDKVMPVFEKAIERLASDPGLIEKMPKGFLQTIMGDLGGSDPKLMIAQFEAMRKSGETVGDVLKKFGPELWKAHKEQTALDSAWKEFSESLAGVWDSLTAALENIFHRLGMIAGGPLKVILKLFVTIAEAVDGFLSWVEKSNVALSLTQALLLGLAAAPIFKLVKVFRALWHVIAGAGKALKLLSGGVPAAGAAAAVAASGAKGAAATVAATTAGRAAAATAATTVAAKTGLLGKLFGGAAGGAAATAGTSAAATGGAAAAKTGLLGRMFGGVAATTAGSQAAAGAAKAASTAGGTGVGGFMGRVTGALPADRVARVKTSFDNLLGRKPGEGGYKAGPGAVLNSPYAGADKVAAAAAKKPSMLTRAGRLAKGVGKGAGAMGWLGAGMNAMGAYSETMEETGSMGQAASQAAGSGLGFVGGAAFGAAVGSFAGPLGTVAGGMIGGAIGSEVGQAAMGAIAEIIFPVSEAEMLAREIGKKTKEGAAEGTAAGQEKADAKKQTLEQRAQKLGDDIRASYQRAVPDDQQWQDMAGKSGEATPEIPLGEGTTDLDRAAKKMQAKEAMYKEGGEMTGFQKLLKEQDGNAKYAALGMPSPYAEESDSNSASLGKMRGMTTSLMGEGGQKLRDGMLLDKMDGMEIGGHPAIGTPGDMKLERLGLNPKGPKGAMQIGDKEESHGMLMPKGGIGVSAPDVNVNVDNDKVVAAIEKNEAASKQIVELLKSIKQEGSGSKTYSSPFSRSASEWRS